MCPSACPLKQTKDNPSAGPKKTQPTVGGGKGVHAPVSKPWLKPKGGKKGAKSKQCVPHHIFKLGGTGAVQPKILKVIRFVSASAQKVDVLVLLMDHDVQEAYMFVQSVTTLIAL